MPILVNAYSTLRVPPARKFAHQQISQRDRSDPELANHLRGFAGFAFKSGGGKMNQSLFHLINHIQRVRNQFSFNIEQNALEATGQWALQANAILFLPDGSIRDPMGRILMDSKGTIDPKAVIPYPNDAISRRDKNLKKLANAGVNVAQSLPPIAGEGEVILRSASVVAQRSLALLITAVRAESVSFGDPIPISHLKTRMPMGYSELTIKEIAFLNNATPDRKEMARFGWRYEAVFLLQWSLGLVHTLPYPSQICDAGSVTKTGLALNSAEKVKEARLRKPEEILDEADLHLRMHWAARQARLDKRPAPAKLNEEILMERHHALNWLVQFQDQAWDDVETPT